jgi:sulfite reductase beta subunit-like hemoprotein
MAVTDDAKTIGRARLDFADEHDIDEFVDMLGKFERQEISPEDWRRFRLVRGTYGQRQDNVQMLRIKIPQGIVTASQMRALANVATRVSRGFCHITTRQNIQYHFVPLPDVESAMRELADEGLTTREACGNSVRNVTACPLSGVCQTETFDVTPYANAITYFLLGHDDTQGFGRKFKVAFSGCKQNACGLTNFHDLGCIARTREVDGRVVRLSLRRLPVGRRCRSAKDSAARTPP